MVVCLQPLKYSFLLLTFSREKKENPGGWKGRGTGLRLLAGSLHACGSQGARPSHFMSSTITSGQCTLHRKFMKSFRVCPHEQSPTAISQLSMSACVAGGWKPEHSHRGLRWPPEGAAWACCQARRGAVEPEADPQCAGGPELAALTRPRCRGARRQAAQTPRWTSWASCVSPPGRTLKSGVGPQGPQPEVRGGPTGTAEPWGGSEASTQHHTLALPRSHSDGRPGEEG